MFYNHGEINPTYERFHVALTIKNIHGKLDLFGSLQNFALHKNRKKMNALFLGHRPTGSCDLS